MDDLQEKLGAVLNDPNMMQQIMSMAQALGNSQQEQDPQQKNHQSQNHLPQIDMETIKKLSGLASHNNIDRNQQALLSALGPYLHRERISKLERAMRAARMALFASSALGSGGLRSLLGR